MKNIRLLQTSQKGQGTVEYALITLAVIAIIVAVLMGNGGFRAAIGGAYNRATAAINAAAPVAAT